MRTPGVMIWACLAMISAGAAAAPVFADPKGLVEYAYAPYGSGEGAEDPLALYSPSLIELWQAMEARAADDPGAALGFDPMVNAQDFDLDDFAVAEPAVRGDWAIVSATFTNFGAPQEIRFTLVRRAEGWKIDDIESLAGDAPWRLSELLAADPLLN